MLNFFKSLETKKSILYRFYIIVFLIVPFYTIKASSIKEDIQQLVEETKDQFTQNIIEKVDQVQKITKDTKAQLKKGMQDVEKVKQLTKETQAEVRKGIKEVKAVQEETKEKEEKKKAEQITSGGIPES